MKKYKKAFKFLVAGGTAALVEYGVFLVLMLWLAGFQPAVIVAQVVSFSTGLFISFFMNKYWSFQSSGSTRHEFARYLLLAVINLALSTLILWFFIQPLGMLPGLAKFFVMAMVACWNFILFQKFVFVKRTEKV